MAKENKGKGSKSEKAASEEKASKADDHEGSHASAKEAHEGEHASGSDHGHGHGGTTTSTSPTARNTGSSSRPSSS
jgi:hypothetical protein